MASSVDAVAFPVALPDLPSDWEYALLGDLVEDRGICYGIVQPGTVSDNGVPVLRVNNVRNGRIDASDVLRVDPAVEAKFQRSRLRGGEVLLTLVGTLGEVAIVSDSMIGWNVARAVGVLPVLQDPGSHWVAICLRSALCQHCMRSWATTTVQATFNLRDVANLPIPLPPARLREKLAHILGTLDDKIELNRRMNATLEGISRALFKSWFVDFDPVRRKATGKQPVGMDAQTAALFPDSFEESEIGEVPKGWGGGVVGDLYDITMGQSPPGDTYNESGDGLPFFQGRADFSFRYPERRVFCTTPTRLAAPGDTLVSVRAPVGDINMALERCAVGRGVAAVRHKTGAIGFTYYSMLALSSMFEKFEGEGTVFGSMGKKEFHGIKVVAPAEDVIHAFEHAIAPQNKQIENLERQTASLAALRDTLLPKLLSGELRVPDAEEAVEEAVR